MNTPSTKVTPITADLARDGEQAVFPWQSHSHSRESATCATCPTKYAKRTSQLYFHF